MSVPASRASQYFRVVELAAIGVVAALFIADVASRAGPHWFTPLLPPEALPKWLVLSVVIFLAAVVSSIVGFAFSAIAGALILHHASSGVEAVQIMMVASVGIQAYSVAGLYRSIQWSRCAPFVLGGIAALPIGILLLLNLHPGAYALAMGAALVVCGLFKLLKRPVLIKSVPRGTADVLVGALGGITGPLAALPGAWLTIWCGMRGWDKVAQRAVFQPYILIMQIVAFTGLALVQPQRPLDPALFAYALPALGGAVIGLRVFYGLTNPQFERIISVALVASGSALALK